MKYFLAVDIGASSGRHILAHAENGRLIAEEVYRFKNSPRKVLKSDGKEHFVWDYEHIYSEILSGLKEAKKTGKIPSYVGIDTWGVDYALLDENDRVVDDIYCYRDFRTEEVTGKVHDIIPFEELYKKTGIGFATFNTVYQLYCDLLNGTMEKASSFLMLPDYFNFRLTGIKDREYTDATTTGMVNAVTHEWDDGIIQKLGFKKSLFKPLSEPGRPVGNFGKEVEKILGYNAVVMHPASHDTASAVLAAPLTAQTPYISSGTWSLLGVEQDSAHTGKEALKSGYSNEGGINRTFRLQKNIMGLWMIQCVKKELKDRYSFQELADMARKSRFDCDMDVNAQKFMMPGNMTEEIEKEAGTKLDPGQLAYVIYDNLAKCYAKSIGDLEKVTGKRYDTLNIIGGGSKNGFLNELTAKYTGKTVITGPAEGTALGNIIMQMAGAGEIKDIYEGRKLIRNSFDIAEVKI